MYWLDTLIPYRLYKNKRILYDLTDPKKKFNGNLIFLDSKDKKESINLINNQLINNKYTKCYYVDKVNYAYIRNSKKKKLINQANYFKEVKSSCNGIIKTYNTLDKYENLSTYFDISPYNELFYTNTVGFSVKQKISAYANFLNHLFDNTDINSYSHKYLLCEINNKYSKYEDYKDSLNDFLSIVLNAIFYNDDALNNYPNLEIIVLGASSGRLFHFNIHSLQKKSLPLLRRLISIIIKLERNEALNEEEQNEDSIADLAPAEEEDTNNDKELAKTMIKSELSDNDNQPTTETQKEILMKVDNIIDKQDDNIDLTTLEDQLNNDEEFLRFLNELKQEKLTAEMDSKNTARNELLKEQQKNLRINNNENSPTLEEIMKESKEKSVQKEILPIESKNKEVLKTSTLKDFEKSYNENLDYKDKLTILNSLSDNNRTIKVYVRDIKIENTSTSFTKKETWTIELEDERRLRHTVKVDFPIMINDKFMYIDGNKKILNKQLCLLPLIKTKPDEVQIVTNSNKTFITRFGQKTSPKMEKLKKFLSEIQGKGIVEFKLGNNLKVNSKYLSNIEYDELSEIYSYLKIGNTTIYFNQNEVRDIFKEKKFDIPNDKNIVPLAVQNGKPVLYNMTTNVLYYNNTETEINIADYIVDLIVKKDSNLLNDLNNINVPKKYIYTRCDILSRKIPLLLFLAYNEGLSTVLHKAKVTYTLSEKRRVLSTEEKEKIGCIPFRDMYLYYDIYPIKNSFLLNSLLDINTKDYDFEMFDNKEVYLEIFFTLYGTRTISKGFDNFYELFIDGITKEVLNDLNYPTDVTGLFLYANELLQDNQYISESDMANYRLRSNELINAIFEKELESAYVIYKNSINGATPIKISLPQNAILNALANNKYGAVLQDYDTLNPIMETNRVANVTYKGPSG